MGISCRKEWTAGRKFPGAERHEVHFSNQKRVMSKNWNDAFGLGWRTVKPD